jgi:5-hydroxyisourate hydrolase-like protein (transthyretin family)
MAYQPKSYRKFVATAATATIVASAVAPVSAAGFTDVSDKYKEAVDFVVEKGANGLTETSFGVSKEIKRVDAAVLLANVLELDIENAPASGFTDVPARAQGHVNALKEAGITSGKTTTKFDAESPITRGELAIWIQRGFELEGSADLAFTDVGDRYVEAVKALVTNEITNGVSDTKFGVGQNAKRGDYAIFLHEASLAVEDKAPALESGIAGFIFDGGEPVVDATVTVGDKTATTDEKGYYKLLDVQPGSQDVTVAANGYQTVTTSDVKVLADKVSTFTKDINSVEINTGAIEVSGVVVDSDTGVAINAADVTLESYDAETEEWNAVAEVQTDATGEYVIDQSAASSNLKLGAEYRLTVSIDGYKDSIQTITLDNQKVSNVLKGIELDAIAAMDVTGTVTDADGEKVNGAAVKIYDAEGTELETTTTDAEGVYSVEDMQLLSGTYNVVVDHANSAVSYTEFDAEEGTDATHDVQLEAGNAIAATIGTESLSDNFGSSDADEATYTMEILNGKTVIATEEFDSVVSNPDSTLSFDFSRIAPGTYTLKLSGDYVVTEEYSITVDGDETFEERAVPAGKISGTVTDSEGAIVNLVDADGNVVDTTEAGTAGAYEFTGVNAGKYKVETSKEGFVSETSDEVTVTKNAETQVAAIALDAVVTTGDVAGYVRTSETLAAVANATVTYYDADGEEVDSASVDANGSYSLSDLEAGTYDVVVRGDAVETYTTTQTIAAGDNLTKVNYNLTQGGDASLEVTVVDSEGNPVDVAAAGFDLADAFVGVTNPTVGTWEEAVSAVDTVTFNNLSAGTYDLDIDVSSEDYVDVETTVSVATGEELELKIVVDEVAAQSDVNFRVVNEANANVEGAYVVVFKEDGTIKDILTTTAGTEDLALVDGNYTLAVYHDGYVVSEQAITVEGKDVNVPVIQLAPIK